MRLDLTGRHVDITDGVRRVIESKLTKLERKLNDSAVSAQVVLSREKGSSRVDVTLHARGEKFLHAVGKGAAFGVAMSDATDRLTQQAQKLKGKWEDRKRRASKAARLTGGEATTPSASAAAASPKGKQKGAAVRTPRTVKTIRHELASMSLAAATRTLSSNQPVTVYRDAETNKIAVLFLLDGSLTLIETDA